MGPARDGWRGRKKGRERGVSSSPQACLRPSASPPECRHGRLEAVGAGGSPAPKAKQPPAGLHGGRREEGWRGEREQKRSSVQKNSASVPQGHAYQTETG